MKKMISMKTMIYLLTLLTFYICLSASSCNNEEQHRYIYIKNNFSKAIYYRLSFAFPDTTLKESDPNNYKINSGVQTFTAAKSFAYNPTMQMFILDADVVEKEPWDSIVAHYEILKRYQFTESDMQNWNWTITYP
ncbi:MAG: hypothetical protein JJE53_03710 [Candidatus Pacebacteria bacterium]|nr:hypothetical protein [Candidatus Paceibacterota bacterium]